MQNQIQSHNQSNQQESSSNEREKLIAQLGDIENFKKSWLYAELQEVLNEKYNSLFDSALGGDDANQRVYKIEQMKGVAYGMQAINMLEQELNEMIKDIK